MIISPKLRVLTHAALHNPLATLGQAGIFVFMSGATALVISATFFNVSHHTGLDHGSWVDVASGIFFALMTSLAVITIFFNNVERSRSYLRPFAEQTQGFVYRSEDFEARMQAAANRRLNLPEDQLALF